MRGSAGKRGLFGFERLLNARRRVDAVDVVRIKLQIAGERAELGGVRQAGEGIFGGDGRDRPAPNPPSGGCRRCERSEVWADPTRLPTKTRSPARRDPASFNVSSARMRTCAENSSPSASVHSASVAPRSQRQAHGLAG